MLYLFLIHINYLVGIYLDIIKYIYIIRFDAININAIVNINKNVNSISNPVILTFLCIAVLGVLYFSRSLI